VAYRVLQLGTGFVGMQALRGIIDHPELELVGLVVHSDDKVGKDAGELCGRDPVGVVASGDFDAALAIPADVCCYEARSFGRLRATIDQFCQILDSGKNIVSTSVGAFIHPATARPDVRARVEEACRRGGTTCFVTGIEPGFFSDYLPVVLSGCFRRIDEIRIYELATYASGGNSDQVAFDIFAFGKPMDVVPPMVTRSALVETWGGVIVMIAEQVGIHIDDIATSYELHPANEGFDFQGAHIDAGTIAAVRFEIVGIVDGKSKVAVEHVTRTRHDVAPQWARPLGGDAYRVVISGSPRLQCEFQFDEGGDGMAGGYNITAMRVVNAIPAVCAARPGLVSTFDLPMITGRHRMS